MVSPECAAGTREPTAEEKVDSNHILSPSSLAPLPPRACHRSGVRVPFPGTRPCAPEMHMPPEAWLCFPFKSVSF